MRFVFTLLSSTFLRRIYTDKTGRQEKFDTLPDVFEWSTAPKKRSAAARLSRTSFLDELTDEQLATYTDEQVQLILDQRSQVRPLLTSPYTSKINQTNIPNQLLDILAQPEYSPSPSPTLDQLASSIFDPPSSSNTTIPSLFAQSPTTTNSKTPWLPLPNGECQFKCCHTCRPTLLERSHLRLNAIANGEIPSTALLGFGFHLNRERPVIHVNLWRKIGLRENPKIVSSPSFPSPFPLLTSKDDKNNKKREKTRKPS